MTEMTGRLAVVDGSEAVVIERTYRAPAADVWAACTEPARMERWIGTWSGDPAAGEIAFRMTAEGDDVPEEVFLVETCEPPHRFALRGRDPQPFGEDGSGPAVHWSLRLDLAEADGVTTLRFVQVLDDDGPGADMAASVGPGWEYYLARLTEHLEGGDPERVDFDDFVGGSAYYRALWAARPR